MPGPLDHLNVVELADAMPVAIAGMLLVDHGADVVKVEPRGGAYFAHDLTRKSWDRSKKSVELDVAEPADLASLRGLLAGADIFIHALEEKAAAALGLDEAGLARDFPELVVCALTAYGADTPFADRPHGEGLAAALLGTMIDKGSSFRSGPVYLGHPALHYGQAFLGVIGALAAIRARRHIGRGQRVEASLLDAMIAQSPMNNWWQEDGISYIKAGDSGAVDRFGRTRLVTAMFECADGLFLQIHTGGPGGFKAAMDVLGFGDRVQAVKGAEMAVPLSEDEYHIARVEVFDAFKTKPRAEWIALFQAADVAALPVLEPAEVLLDDQVEFVGQRVALPDPDFGTIYQAAPAVRYANTPCAAPKPAPVVGADNGALADLIARRRAVLADGKPLDRPLEGVKIVDFSSFFAVGYGGRLLSDLGADVIKIETPDGDQMRPLPDVFDAAQRGKRSLAINLKHDQAPAVLDRLLETADVVTTNWRPGAAARLGLDFDALHQRFPRLVWCNTRGFEKGARSDLPGTDQTAAALTGTEWEDGACVHGHPPLWSRSNMGDTGNALLAVMAIVAALYHRDRTGEGQAVSTSIVNAGLFHTSYAWIDADGNAADWGHVDADQYGLSTWYRMFRCADDRWIFVAALRPDEQARLLEVMGEAPALVEDPDKAAATLEVRFAQLDASDWFTMLDGQVPVEVVDELFCRDLFNDPEARASGLVAETWAGAVGRFEDPGLLVSFSATPGIVQRGPAMCGEHSREILSELGFDGAAIDALAAAGAILDSPVRRP